MAIFPEYSRFRVRPYVDVSRHPMQRVGIISGNALSFQYRAGIAFRLQELAYLHGFPVQSPVQLFYPQQLLYPFQFDGSGGRYSAGSFRIPSITMPVTACFRARVSSSFQVLSGNGVSRCRDSRVPMPSCRSRKNKSIVVCCIKIGDEKSGKCPNPILRIAGTFLSYRFTGGW